ncbi:MAG: AAA family ATPase [Bacteroidetes bacterium]|nr:AAA family ATPase [Bacteroidota bacterium]
MRISKIKIPLTETQTVNLKEINLCKKPLGSVVALVGKNGAGKSRILKFVENYIKKINYENYFDDHLINIPTTIISQFEQNIATARQYQKALENNNLNGPQIQQTKHIINQNMSGFLQRLQQLGQAYIKIVDNDDLKNIKANINNGNAITFERILKNTHFDSVVANPSLIQQAESNPLNQQSILLNEFTAFNNQSTISYLTRLTNEIITDEFNLYIKHRQKPELIKDEIQNKTSFQLFDKFQGYVKQFLGKDFSYQQNAQGNTVNSTLFYNNEPFNLTQFSPGQKTLFAYAILFFYLDINSKTNIRESIIIIDEPEKHLHPEAQITLINALKSIIGKTGQLWIATHSIHILSHLDYDEIMMVKDDEIIPPSRTTPGKSFNDLMGIDEHLNELISFITSISEWAYGNFMVQCFKEPDVIFGKNINDPQYKIFKTFLNDMTSIELLDFGAGKGRIGYTIQEDEMVSKKVIYSAFEPDKGNYAILNNVPDKKVIYSNLNEIPINNYDCVVLCNVLHEINPKEWVNILTSIKNLLKENGYLLIIEDRYLPKGENAHEFGYLVFGNEETKILLSSSSSMLLKLDEVEYSERIIFNAFLKSEINPSTESVINSIKKLKENCFVNIKSFKKKVNDINQGRRYANETQLYINAQLALEILKK